MEEKIYHTFCILIAFRNKLNCRRIEEWLLATLPDISQNIQQSGTNSNS